MLTMSTFSLLHEKNNFASQFLLSLAITDLPTKSLAENIGIFANANVGTICSA